MLETIKRYKTPIITIIIVTAILLLMLSIGFTIGILSENPDGLEKTLEDLGVEEPEPFFEALLGWINNEHVRAIVGIILIVSITSGVYYILVYVKKKRITRY